MAMDVYEEREKRRNEHKKTEMRAKDREREIGN